METTRLQKENASVSRNKSGERGYGAAAHDSAVSPFPSGIRVQAQLESRLRSSLGGGQGLPNPVRSQMESAFGQSFSRINIHTDSAAAEMSRSIGAKAFTFGNDIFFNQGQYNPDSSSGRHLIAHELTHVAQGSGRIGREPTESPDEGSADEAGASEESKTPANAEMLEKARNIQVTGGEKGDPVAGAILTRINTDQKLGIKSMTVQSINANDSDKKGKTATICGNIKGVISDTDRIIDLAKQYREESQKEPESAKAKDNRSFAQQLVQQAYNTLSQISVAMDMLPKPKIANNNVDSLKNEAWIICRNEFDKAVTKLAQVAKNPAIAVLMYEGTFYPTEFSGKTSTATSQLIAKHLDSALLYYYGAVCNNAAYGSVYASGANYKFKSTTDEADRKRIVGLQESGTSRTVWNNYDLQGTGVGNDALDHSKQGDVVIFWHFSKVDDSTSKKENEIVSKLKKQRDAADKQLKAAQAELAAAEKALKKANKAKDEKSKEEAQARLTAAEDSLAEAELESKGLNQELKEKQSAKKQFDALRKADQSKRAALKKAEKKIQKVKPSQRETNAYLKAKAEFEEAHQAYLKFISEESKFYNADLRRAQAEYEDASDQIALEQKRYSDAEARIRALETEKTQAGQALDAAQKKLDAATPGKRGYNKIQTAVVDANARLEAAESNLTSARATTDFDVLASNIESAKEHASESKDKYADAIVNGDVNAHHTEIVVGIREKDGKREYLLSGAHGSNFVNGMARNRGKLAWKTAEEVRGDSILRCVPVDNDEDLIPVDIPSVMEEQNYSLKKKEHEGAAAKAYKEQHPDVGKMETLADLQNYLTAHPDAFITNKDALKSITDGGDKATQLLNEAVKKETGAWKEKTKDGHTLGSYETDSGTVYTYGNQNLRKSVTIYWIGNVDKPQDTSQEASE